MGDMTTFMLDARSRKALEELRETIGASSNAEVIRVRSPYCKKRRARPRTMGRCSCVVRTAQRSRFHG